MQFKNQNELSKENFDKISSDDIVLGKYTQIIDVVSIVKTKGEPDEEVITQEYTYFKYDLSEKQSEEKITRKENKEIVEKNKELKEIDEKRKEHYDGEITDEDYEPYKQKGKTLRMKVKELQVKQKNRKAKSIAVRKELK